MRLLTIKFLGILKLSYLLHPDDRGDYQNAFAVTIVQMLLLVSGREGNCSLANRMPCFGRGKYYLTNHTTLFLFEILHRAYQQGFSSFTESFDGV